MRDANTIDQLIAHRALSSLPAVWVDLAHGRISAADAAEAALEHEPVELVERSRALFEPPTEAQVEGQLDALLEAHFPEPAAASSRRWWIGLASAAAAAFLLLTVPPLLDSSPDDASIAVFDAGYSLTLHRGYEGMRAADPAAAGSAVYVEGRELELRLRPRHSVSPEPEVRVFATTAERTLVLPIEPRINEDGIVTIVGSTTEAGLRPGRWQLTVVVGAPGTLPESLDGIRADAGSYEVVKAEIEVVSPDELPSSG